MEYSRKTYRKPLNYTEGMRLRWPSSHVWNMVNESNPDQAEAYQGPRTSYVSPNKQNFYRQSEFKKPYLPETSYPGMEYGPDRAEIFPQWPEINWPELGPGLPPGWRPRARVVFEIIGDPVWCRGSTITLRFCSTEPVYSVKIRSIDHHTDTEIVSWSGRGTNKIAVRLKVGLREESNSIKFGIIMKSVEGYGYEYTKFVYSDCEAKQYLAIRLALYEAQASTEITPSRWVIWDATEGEIAADIPDGGGGFVEFPCEYSEIDAFMNRGDVRVVGNSEDLDGGCSSHSCCWSTGCTGGGSALAFGSHYLTNPAEHIRTSPQCDDAAGTDTTTTGPTSGECEICSVVTGSGDSETSKAYVKTGTDVGCDGGDAVSLVLSGTGLGWWTYNINTYYHPSLGYSGIGIVGRMTQTVEGNVSSYCREINTDCGYDDPVFGNLSYESALESLDLISSVGEKSMIPSGCAGTLTLECEATLSVADQQSITKTDWKTYYFLGYEETPAFTTGAVECDTVAWIAVEYDDSPLSYSLMLRGLDDAYWLTNAATGANLTRFYPTSMPMTAGAIEADQDDGFVDEAMYGYYEVVVGGCTRVQADCEYPVEEDSSITRTRHFVCLAGMYVGSVVALDEWADMDRYTGLEDAIEEAIDELQALLTGDLAEYVPLAYYPTITDYMLEKNSPAEDQESYPCR